MQIRICHNDDLLSHRAAEIIADLLRTNPNGAFTFATGATPLGTYRQLARMSKEEGLDFSQATAFHLDEYVGLRDDPQSYRRYLKDNVFDHIHFARVHFLDGCAQDLDGECLRYDRMLRAAGVEVLLAGIGVNGHIAFNEPPAVLDGRTHIQELSEETRRANSRFFGSLDDVPRQALTQGMGTILEARRILLLATGANKADAIAQALEGPVTGMCPASALQRHPNVTVLLDEAAAGKLLRKYPQAERRCSGFESLRARE